MVASGWSATLIISLLAGTLAAGIARGQTIDAMYFDIPSEALGLEPGLTQPAKQKLIKELDAKNGFLALSGESHIELAKFSRKSGGPLLAVADTSYADGGGFAENLRFFEQKGKGDWVNVTATYLPTIPGIVVDAFAVRQCGKAVSDSASGTYRYRLPRKGLVIRAVAESDALTKPCKGDLFHLRFVDTKIANMGWHTKLTMELVSD